MIKNMKPVDWLLAILLVGLVTAASAVMVPRYGWIIGLLLGAFLAYRAIVRRDRMIAQDRERINEGKKEEVEKK
jgi:hypothetical protein